MEKRRYEFESEQGAVYGGSGGAGKGEVVSSYYNPKIKAQKQKQEDSVLSGRNMPLKYVLLHKNKRTQRSTPSIMRHYYIQHQQKNTQNSMSTSPPIGRVISNFASINDLLSDMN